MGIEFKKIRKDNLINYHIRVFACLLIIVLEIGSINIVNAEPFIRVYKKGVIYYYFSNKSDMNSLGILGNRTDNLSRINRPLARNKLSALELEPWVKWASQNHKVPPALIKAIIRVESNFNPAATSPKGAQGLMQLMPGTAEQLQVRNSYDIQENIWAGTRYLGMLLQKFNNNLPLALAAYNAGPQRVQKYQGIPPIKETQGFVRDVCTNFLRYSVVTCSPR
jgi:soluble lytic murein transglycosylase-like protein